MDITFRRLHNMWVPNKSRCTSAGYAQLNTRERNYGPFSFLLTHRLPEFSSLVFFLVVALEVRACNSVVAPSTKCAK